MGFLDILGGAGRGILGGVEDVGRGLIGQGGGGGRMDMNALAQLIPDEFTRKAFLQMAMPRTQDLLGPVGKIPVLGPVLGGGLDVLSTLQAARHGGLGRELAARGIGGALPFQGLGQIAGAREKMQALETEKGRGAVLGAQKDEIEDRILRNQQETNADLRYKEAQRISQEATTENAKAAAAANLAQADLYRQQTTTAGRYPGELPQGADPSTIQIYNGKPVVGASPGHGPIVLGNAPAPGKAPGEKPPPMAAMTREQALAKVAAYPKESRAQIRELVGRPGLYTVEVAPIDAGGERRRVVGTEALEKLMPSDLGLGISYGGTDFRDPIQREKGNAILQQITGRPIDIGLVLRDDGKIDREKLTTVLQEQRDMDSARDALIY